MSHIRVRRAPARAAPGGRAAAPHPLPRSYVPSAIGPITDKDNYETKLYAISTEELPTFKTSTVKSETLKMLQSPKQLESLLAMVRQLRGHTAGAGYIEERAFEKMKLGTELNGLNRWFCGAGISKRAVPLSGGGTAM